MNKNNTYTIQKSDTFLDDLGFEQTVTGKVIQSRYISHSKYTQYNQQFHTNYYCLYLDIMLENGKQCNILKPETIMDYLKGSKEGKKWALLNRKTEFIKTINWRLPYSNLINEYINYTSFLIKDILYGNYELIDLDEPCTNNKTK